MTRSAPTGEIEALTSIRGIAAWWVVAFHARFLIAPDAAWLKALLAKGYLAVDMFFVLSGFVIYLNYAGRIAPTRAALTDFFVRRFARIYPLHLLILLATALLVAVLVAHSGELPEAYPLLEFVLSIVLLQAWGFSNPLTWNVPAWSISAEFAAYLVFPMLPLVLRVRAWSTVALTAGILALIGGLHLVYASNDATSLNWRMPTHALLRCLTEFPVGALLCELYLRASPRTAAGLSLPLLAAAAALVCGVAVLGWPETLAMPLLWVALILGIAMLPRAWPNPLRWRPFVYVGDISYGTYLCHYLVFVLFKLLFVGDDRQTSILTLAIFFGSVAAASVVLYHGFERPAQRWVMAHWRARSAAPRAAAAANVPAP